MQPKIISASHNLVIIQHEELQLYVRPQLVTQAKYLLEALRLVLAWHKEVFETDNKRKYIVFMSGGNTRISNPAQHISFYEADVAIDPMTITPFDFNQFLSHIAYKFFEHVYYNCSAFNKQLAMYLALVFTWEKIGYTEARITYIINTRLNAPANFETEFLHALLCTTTKAAFLSAAKSFLLEQRSATQTVTIFVAYLEKTAGRSLQNIFELYSEKELFEPMEIEDHDPAVNLWSIWQNKFTAIILGFVSIGTRSIIDEPLSIVPTLEQDLNDPQIPDTIKAELLSLPSEKYVATHCPDSNLDVVCRSYNALEMFLAQMLQPKLLELQQKLGIIPDGSFDVKLSGKRRAHDIYELYALCLNKTNPAIIPRITAGLGINGRFSNLFLYRFFYRFVSESARIFHQTDGAGYKLVTDVIIYLLAHNGAKLANLLLNNFDGWRSLDRKKQHLILDQITRLVNHGNLSVEMIDHLSELLGQKPATGLARLRCIS